MSADVKTVQPNNSGESAIDPKAAFRQELSELSGSEEGGSYDDGKNPFKDPVVAERWRVQYETSKYECRHLFDPVLSWTEEEEKRLVRKLDWRVCLWAVG